MVNTILAAAYEGQGNFDAAIEVRDRALIPLYRFAEQDPKAVDLKLWLELEAAITAQQERIGR